MTANHRRDLLDMISDLKRQVADLQGSRTLGAQSALCTSTTHPPNPAIGRWIHETDTGLEARGNGTAWVYPTQVIRTQTLTAPAASFTFSALPSAFNFVRLEWRVHASAGTAGDLLMQVDGNSSALYLWAKNEAAAAVQANFHGNSAQTFMKIGALGGSTAGYFSSGSLSIAGWASATGYLSAAGTSALFDTNTSDYVGAYGGLYAATGPHSSLTVYPASGSFVAGSQLVLVGVG